MRKKSEIMKKQVLLLFGTAILFFSSCERDIYPYADFAVDKTLVYPGEVIHFSNYSTDAVSYTWDFGDGYSSTATHPTHFYDEVGIYTVILTARSKDGHIDQAQITIEVDILLMADFDVDYTKVQPGEVVSFTNYSEGAVSYFWDFGDGYTSTVANPVHSYTEEGIYTVTLTATAIDGSTDAVYIQIEVVYTLLQITVAEWNSSETVEIVLANALVILYNTLEDWEADENTVAYGYTDGTGDIIFAGVESRSYWVWAEANNVYVEGDWYDNYQFYEDYMDDYISTPVLQRFALNTWIAWVDYYEPVKKSTKVSRLHKYTKDKIKSNDPSFIKIDVSK
jgi:PKD repeat protein